MFFLISVIRAMKIFRKITKKNLIYWREPFLEFGTELFQSSSESEKNLFSAFDLHFIL